MKTYTIFTSIYDDIQTVLAMKLRDNALEENNTSANYIVNTSTLSKAIDSFCNSTVFAHFDQVPCTFYLIEPNGIILSVGEYLAAHPEEDTVDLAEAIG